MQQFKNNPITEEGIKHFVDALDVVWKRKEAQAKQDSSRITQRITALKSDIDNRAIAAIDPSNANIKAEILANIEKLKTEVKGMEEELAGLTQKADVDKDRFLKFALNFVDNMGENFLLITPENRAKCKQIIFPAGFYLDANKNVYTPEISPLIRYATNKKDLPEAEKSLLVRVMRL